MRCMVVVLQLSIMLVAAPSISLGAVAAASWYDSNSVKREGTCHADKCYTASGREIHELERRGIFFIASNSLKLKSKVRVCNSRGEKCEEAIVLDRGGFKKYGRQADLCKALFEKFAPLSQGITTVTITKLK